MRKEMSRYFILELTEKFCAVVPELHLCVHFSDRAKSRVIGGF